MTAIPLLLALAVQPAPKNLEAVLQLMDRAAASFHTMTGKLNKTTHTAVINDTSEESGAIWMKRQGKHVRVLVEVKEPDPKSYALRDRKAEIYLPKIQTVQEYDLGKHAQLLDQFLLLGFGTPTRELARSYRMRLVGQETLGNEKVFRIELIPKSGQVRQHLLKAELWVSGEGYTVRQKFHEPSGDFRLVSYSDVRWNPNLTDESVSLKVPKNVKREFPQR
jgi:outer membrane lipoprotein-sorting protein